MLTGIKIKGLETAAKKVLSMPKQTRFATSLAINNTLKDVQAFTTETILPDVFTLRSRGAPWHRRGTRFGFNIKFSKKNNLTGILGSRADWLEYQEDAGVKKVQGHRLAVPTPFWKKRDEIMSRKKKPKALLREWNRSRFDEDSSRSKLAREIKTGVRVDETGRRRRSTTRSRGALSVSANRSKRRRQLIGSLTQKPFLYEGSKMPEGIYVRTGNERRSTLKMLFRFLDSAKIKTPLHFEKKGEKRIDEVFDGEFRKAFLRAVATAK